MEVATGSPTRNMRHTQSDSFIHFVDHDKNLPRLLRELPSYRAE
jgi:hypothetical protein